MRRKFIIREIRKQFECQRCNLCCKAPGYVFLGKKEANRIANYLKLKYESFVSQYCKTHEGHLVLKSEADGACIFLNDQGCAVNDVKPKQCRDFPYVWRDPDAYDYCEGIKKIKQSGLKTCSS